MIDTDGTEWLTVTQAARIVRVRVETVRVWVSRGRVGRHREFVNMADVREAEHAWRVRLGLVNHTGVISLTKETCP